jgi:hypothetical protein
VAWLLCAVPVWLPAASADSLGKDSSNVTVRQPAAATQQQYYSDDYYRYERKKGLEGETFFDRMLRSLFDRDEREEQDPNMPNSGSAQSITTGAQALNYLLLAVAVGLLVWGLIRALKSGAAGKIFSGKTKDEEEIDASVEDVDIHAINYENQIAAARDRGDFRYAVRLWFLNTLKNFSDRELLHWKPEKTNMDYFYELSGNPVQQKFGDASRVYDFVWYGEREINANDYENAEQQFRELNRSLN